MLTLSKSHRHSLNGLEVTKEGRRGGGGGHFVPPNTFNERGHTVQHFRKPCLLKSAKHCSHLYIYLVFSNRIKLYCDKISVSFP